MRKTFLIKPKLQLTHLAYTLGAVIVASVIGYGLFEAVIKQAVAPSFLELGEWVQLRSSLRLGFGLVVLILMIVIGLENFFFFHSIVGPLYVLEKSMRRLVKGNFHDVIQTRETDHLDDLVESFKAVRDYLVTQVEEQELLAQELSTELEYVLKNTSQENIEALQSKLKKVREQAVKKAA